jgi:hypothetical protein
VHSESQQTEAVEETSDASPPEGAEAAREVFTSMEKALKMRRLYERGHKVRTAALDELFVRFERVLETCEVLDIAVGPDAFLVDDEVVFRDERRESSIPFKLFRDGVRGLTIIPGLPREELRRFLDVLEATPEAPGSFDEDMATLLWREAFQHVRHLAVDELATSSGDSGGESASALDDLGARVDGLVGRITSHEVPADLDLGDGVHVSAARREVFELERQEARFGPGDGSQEAGVEVPAEVLDRLRAELEREDIGRLIQRVVDILFDLYGHEECNLRLDDIRGLLGQFLRIIVEQGELDGLNRMLDRFLLSSRTDPEGPAGQLVGAILDDLATESSLGLLRRVLKQGYVGGPDALSRLLVRLPAAALGTMARHLEDVPEGPEREVFERVLRSRGRENPEALVLHLKDGSAEKVLEALEVLQAEAPPASVAFVLSELLGHEDPKVRMEAVRVTETVPEEAQDDLLGRALFDPLPRVRQTVLRVVERVGAVGLLPTLTGRVEGDGVSPDERVRLFHAIAVLGGPQAVACLEKHLGERKMSWLRGKKSFQEQRTALLSLRDVEDHDVRAFLERGTGSKDRAFADACRATLALARAEEERRR